MLPLSCTDPHSLPGPSAVPSTAAPTQLTGLELNRHLYARIAPPKPAPFEVHRAWERSILPAVVTMVLEKRADDLRRFLQQAFAERDVRHLCWNPTHPTCVVRPRNRDRSNDRPPGRSLPRIGRVAPSARAANVPDQVRPISAALVWLTGDRQHLQSGMQIRLRASGREIAEVAGCSHVYVFKVVQSKGENSQALVRLHVPHPSDGAGHRGINKDTGGRRRAAAHPSNEYQLLVTDEILQLARQIEEERGLPLRPVPYEIVELAAPVTEEQRRAAVQQWDRIHQTLWDSSIHPDRILRLLGGLTPIAFDGVVLTVQGAVLPAAVEMLERFAPCRLRFLLPPGT